MKKWLLLLILIAALVGTHRWISSTPTDLVREELNKPIPIPKPAVKQAKLVPGRVVELHTNRGEIDFVMFEKDAPKSTARIVDLVTSGKYNKVKFPRVENWVIQTADANRKVPDMECELVKGIYHIPGTVGMARRGGDYKSVASSFYIVMNRPTNLDADYTIIGQTIRGMDVVKKIKKGDRIETATIRPANPSDLSALTQVLSAKGQPPVPVKAKGK